LYTITNMYTTKEVAKQLGYACDAVIRKMIADKRINAKKIGHIWVISDRELKRLKNKLVL